MKAGHRRSSALALSLWMTCGCAGAARPAPASPRATHSGPDTSPATPGALRLDVRLSSRSTPSACRPPQNPWSNDSATGAATITGRAWLVDDGGETVADASLREQLSAAPGGYRLRATIEAPGFAAGSFELDRRVRLRAGEAHTEAVELGRGWVRLDVRRGARRLRDPRAFLRAGESRVSTPTAPFSGPHARAAACEYAAVLPGEYVVEVETGAATARRAGTIRVRPGPGVTLEIELPPSPP